MPAKSMRKVTLGFSLVSVPCKVYKATEDHDTHFNQIHNADNGRIGMRRFCSICDREVPYEDIGRGHEVGDRMIPVSNDELDSLPVPSASEIVIDQFTDADSVDPLLLNGKHYYLGPDVGGDKGYMLMVQAMADSGRVALAKVALHGRERVAAIRPVNGVLVMNLLSWPEEIRNADEVPFKATPKPADAERDLAIQLIDAMTAPFDPGKYKDEYAAALSALVEAKMNDSGAASAPVTPKPVPASQPSMTDQLQRALADIKPSAKSRKKRTS